MNVLDTATSMAMDAEVIASAWFSTENPFTFVKWVHWYGGLLRKGAQTEEGGYKVLTTAVSAAELTADWSDPIHDSFNVS